MNKQIVAAIKATAVERDRLKAVNAELVAALEDIAGGLTWSAEFPIPSVDQSPEAFRSEMWTWSQARARAALAKARS